jgi:uncharacterized protein with HEPN domain
MSRHERDISLHQMLDHAREAQSLVQGKSRSDLDTDRLLNLALVRLLEIVGEAARRFPQEDQYLYPEIPWHQIISLRNRLIHGYDEVDFDILWKITTDDLPTLISALERII